MVRRPLARAVAGFGLCVGLAIGLVTFKLQQYDPSTDVVPDDRCSRAPLVAHSQWTFLRHQNWFESAIPVNTDDYVILDLRTNRGYDWSAVSEGTGTRFEVRTRWVLFHPGWADDPWQLLYDC